jgi:cation diffusion facilitator CzcD-associated flavoprotein CzcO/acetyl esterase/lipase
MTGPTDGAGVLKPSWRARLAAFVVRHRVKPALRDMRDIAAVRAVFDEPLSPGRGVRYTPDRLGGLPGEWVEAEAPSAPPAPTLLYLHGGGFVGCSAVTHRPITATLARRGLRVYVPDYRLAPEHPFPAAPQDVLAVYRALRAARPNDRLVVAGDSAGGNLALGLLLTLRDAGEALPAAAALFSPALDLTGASPSITLNAGRDALFDPVQLGHLAEHYLAGADPTQVLASPLLGDMAGLPPLLLHVGDDEVLRDDSIRLAQKAREAGVRVELRVFGGVPHVWQLVRQLPESRRSMRETARFLAEAEPHRGDEAPEVLIVGAGLSGIGAAVHLQRDLPDTSFTILEARDAVGGTWDLFRYPGIRSDSDMYTLGYDFKPWRAPKAIADGTSIRDYIRDTATEHGLAAHIRRQHRVVSADWSSAEGRWQVEIERGPQRERLRMRPRFVLFCSGYYRYAQGHRPAFPGEQHYRGTWVHPQAWPEGLDHAGRRVVVIGSGATAVTLVPELARTAAHVTMLQRSPSYVVARPARDAIASALGRVLPAGGVYRLVRAKNVLLGWYFYRLLRRYPRQAKARLVGMVREALGPDFDVERHFTPRYKPWDQRLCLVPDGDLFAALREGRASVATDEIETFTEHGIRLRSGRQLDADIVVTATGLELEVLGGAALSVDGRPVEPGRLLVYKGMMFSGVPNFANVFGYTNASWTLKADLSARHFCRLLGHLQRRGQTVFTPVPGEDVRPEPFLDFTSGYVQRAADRLPRQGHRAPWRLHQNYLLDLLMLRLGRVQDDELRLSGPAR